MPNRCVVYGCSNYSNMENGISLHKIPFFNDERPEAKRRRKRWVDFVSTKRKHWKPTKDSSVCSEHFNPDDFVRMFQAMDGQGHLYSARLKSDDFGISSFPSVHRPIEETTLSKRSRQQCLKELSAELNSSLNQDIENVSCHDNVDAEVEISNLSSSEEANRSVNEETHACPTTPEVNHQLTQTFWPKCVQCTQLENEVRVLKNKRIDDKEKIKQQSEKIANLQREIINMNEERNVSSNGVQVGTDAADSDGWSSGEESEGSDFVELEPEDDMNFESDGQTETETETETDSVTDDDPKSKRNFNCPKKECIWRSQPNMTGTKIAAGNFLLSFAILLAGGSASKVLQIFSHMGMACISLNTFFRHQRSKLFPTVLIFWKSYREKMLKKIKSMQEPIVMAGDGRHDSMGHSAKYCAYTMFCCNVPAILHFSIVQKNQAANSPAMEFMAFKQAIQYLIDSGLKISTLITDRHLQIAKYMRTTLKNIIHYFDLWHLKKKVHKVLSKISKEKGGEALVPWIRLCENHLLWSALSTSSGNGKVIWAKFKSFLTRGYAKHRNELL